MKTELLSKIKKEIARATSDPEEAEMLTKALAKTDWKDYIESEAVSRYGECKICRYKKRWLDLIHTRDSCNIPIKCCYYCYSNVIRHCFQCGIEYIPYRLDVFTSANESYCDNCERNFRIPTFYQGLEKERFWKEYRIVSANRYRAKSLGLPTTLTANEWIATIKRFDWKCAYCPNGDYECMDHFIPICKGGGTTVLNCVPSCRRCNSAKGDKHPDDMAVNYGQTITHIKQQLEALS
jgi:hypothetical protein